MWKKGDRVKIKNLSRFYPKSLFGLTGTVKAEEDGVYYVRLDTFVPESAEGNTWYFDGGCLEEE